MKTIIKLTLKMYRFLEEKLGEKICHNSTTKHF